MGSRKASDGVYNIMISYCALTQEFVDELNAKSANGTMTDEDINTVTNSIGPLLMAFGIDGGRGAKDLVELMASNDRSDLSEEIFVEVGRHDDITYYVITAPEIP